MEFAGSPLEIKQLSDSGHIEGLLAGFGDVDNGGDRLLPGCFAKTLASRNAPLPMLLFHDTQRPIGAWKSWEERKDGLYVAGDITLATNDGREAHALARDGALTGLSIGWAPKREDVDQRTGVRTIYEAKLYEGSLVALPMHERARVTSIKGITGPRELADLLQEAGFSGRKAKVAAGAAWKALNEGNHEDAGAAELAALLEASAARLSIGVVK
jgi:HK97 family phage prohead protease